MVANLAQPISQEAGAFGVAFLAVEFFAEQLLQMLIDTLPETNKEDKPPKLN